MDESTLSLFKDLSETYQKLPSSALILMRNLITQELDVRNKVIKEDVLKPIKTCVKEANKPELSLVKGLIWKLN